VLGDWGDVRVHADFARTHEAFPNEVSDALAFISAEDVVGYVEAVEDVLESFETRDEYLEDVPVADTVLVLQALAARRSMAAELESPLLSGAEIPEGKGATVRITFHDARKGVRELDVTDAEAEKLGGRQVARRGRRPKSATQ